MHKNHCVSQSGEAGLHPRTSHEVIIRSEERAQHRPCREAFLHYFIYLFMKTQIFLSIFATEGVKVCFYLLPT